MKVKQGLIAISWILAVIGAAVLLSAEKWETVVGVLLLLWANNVYESSKKSK